MLEARTERKCGSAAPPERTVNAARPSGAGPAASAGNFERASDKRWFQWYARVMAEFGLAIFVIGALLITDRDRLEWATAKLRDLIAWLST